jgi:hypothetical protein
MSTKDQLLYSALHGTAMRYAAERRSLAESIEELREIADGRNDILAEAAGIDGDIDPLVASQSDRDRSPPS